MAGWVRTNLVQHTAPLCVQNCCCFLLLRAAGMIEPWYGIQVPPWLVPVFRPVPLMLRSNITAARALGHRPATCV